MLFIARRSDAKDGTVPPEPVGPMEVAPHERSTPSKAHTDHAVPSPISSPATSFGDSNVISGGAH